jgi:hypothetical protein
MTDWLVVFTGVLALAGIIVVGVAAFATYVLYQYYVADPQPELRRERLRAYSDILSDVIAVNRLAVDLSEDDQFQVELERYTMDQESEFTGLLKDLTQQLQRNYHVIDSPVADAVDEYLDFMSTYPNRQIHVGELLSLSSDVVATMRSDLDLPTVFGDAEPEVDTGVTMDDVEDAFEELDSQTNSDLDGESRESSG